MRKTMTGLVVAMGTIFALATAAGAQSAVDPTGGAYADGVSDIQSFITGTAAGPLFVLAAAVVAISVGLRWLKKARGAAS